MAQKTKAGHSPYVSGQLECMELCLGKDVEPNKSLWVKIKGRVGTGDTTVGGLIQATQP